MTGGALRGEKMEKNGLSDTRFTLFGRIGLVSTTMGSSRLFPSEIAWELPGVEAEDFGMGGFRRRLVRVRAVSRLPKGHRSRLTL